MRISLFSKSNQFLCHYYLEPNQQVDQLYQVILRDAKPLKRYMILIRRHNDRIILEEDQPLSYYSSTDQLNLIVELKGVWKIITETKNRLIGRQKGYFILH